MLNHFLFLAASEFSLGGLIIITFIVIIISAVYLISSLHSRKETEKHIANSAETRSKILELLNENCIPLLMTLEASGIKIKRDASSFDAEKFVQFWESQTAGRFDLGNLSLQFTQKTSIFRLLLQIQVAEKAKLSGKNKYRYFYFIKPRRETKHTTKGYWYETDPTGIVEEELPIM